MQLFSIHEFYRYCTKYYIGYLQLYCASAVFLLVSPTMSLLATLLIMAIAKNSDLVGTNDFLPGCTSDDDRGWPRFRSAADLRADKKWYQYFIQVYGMIPEKYPVCVYDFWYIDEPAWEAAGLKSTRSVLFTAMLFILFESERGDFSTCCRSVVTNPTNPDVSPTKLQDGDLFRSFSTTGPGLGIYHEKWTPVPNNTW